MSDSSSSACSISASALVAGEADLDQLAATTAASAAALVSPVPATTVRAAP